jgi:hypothetical protein
MAKLKAELDQERNEYSKGMLLCRQSHDDGDYQQALETAASACEYVDGMMQFEHRYENRETWASIESMEYVFRYAPILFEGQYIKRLAALLKSQKRIQKNVTTDLSQSLAKAQTLMQDAYRLWNHLESQETPRQDDLRTTLGGDQDQWRWIAETWERIGIVRRTPENHSYRLQLVTRLGEGIRGKCPNCGVVGKATKLRLLDKLDCPKCRVIGMFVLLPN